MTKKILGGIAVVVIAAIMALNINFSANNTSLSDISLANVEALAQGEVYANCLCDPTDLVSYTCLYIGAGPGRLLACFN